MLLRSKGREAFPKLLRGDDSDLCQLSDAKLLRNKNAETRLKVQHRYCIPTRLSWEHRHRSWFVPRLFSSQCSRRFLCVVRRKIQKSL